jgi:glycosyltransferase involved in cell wall biosynthesis
MNELEQARCLAFPSLWYETYGLAVDEAAARGVPVIVSDVCAAAERVQHNITGWHTRAGSVDDLSHWLGVVEEGGNAAKAGLAAYDAYWSSPSTPSQHTAALAGIYRSILERKMRTDYAN